MTWRSTLPQIPSSLGKHSSACLWVPYICASLTHVSVTACLMLQHSPAAFSWLQHLVCAYLYAGATLQEISAGEMVVGPKNTLFLDEISTGLDSSTTFLIVRCVRNFVHTLQARPCSSVQKGSLTDQAGCSPVAF